MGTHRLAALLAYLGASHSSSSAVSASGGSPIQRHAYGHLYIRGHVEGVEYYRASFGGLIPCTSFDIVSAPDPTGCDALRFNATTTTLYAGKALLVHRGGCSFHDKAVSAAAVGAIALIVVNSEPGLLRMPMPGNSSAVTTAYMPVVMIPAWTFPAISTALTRAAEWGGVATLHAAMVPFHDECEAAGDDGAGEGGPATSSGTSLPTASSWHPSIVEAGSLEFSSSSSSSSPIVAEFVAAAFGGVFPHGTTPSEQHTSTATSIGVAFAHPALACSPLDNATSALHGRFVVVHRGVCSMVEKARRVEAAGGWGVIIVNSDGALDSPSTTSISSLDRRARSLAIVQAIGDDFLRERRVTIPVLMVSAATGRRLARMEEEAAVGGAAERAAGGRRSEGGAGAAVDNSASPRVTNGTFVKVWPSLTRVSSWEQLIQLQAVAGAPVGATASATNIAAAASPAAATTNATDDPRATAVPVEGGGGGGSTGNSVIVSAPPGSTASALNALISSPEQLARLLALHHPKSPLGGPERLVLLRLVLMGGLGQAGGANASESDNDAAAAAAALLIAAAEDLVDWAVLGE